MNITHLLAVFRRQKEIFRRFNSQYSRVAGAAFSFAFAGCRVTNSLDPFSSFDDNFAHRRIQVH